MTKNISPLALVPYILECFYEFVSLTISNFLSSPVKVKLGQISTYCLVSPTKLAWLVKVKWIYK